MFLKPTFAYGRSWYTFHDELVIPMHHLTTGQPLPRANLLEHPQLLEHGWYKDYADWFLYQLLIRQVSHSDAASNPYALKSFVDRLSFRSFKAYGEGIFS
jgi:hypothetical protein